MGLLDWSHAPAYVLGSGLVRSTLPIITLPATIRYTRHGFPVESIGDSSGPSWTGVTNAPGHDSGFGHPYPAVVERYRLLDVLVIRTDEHGAITVRTDGQSVRIEPYTNQPLMLPHLATQHLAETTLSSPVAAPR